MLVRPENTPDGRNAVSLRSRVRNKRSRKGLFDYKGELELKGIMKR